MIHDAPPAAQLVPDAAATATQATRALARMSRVLERSSADLHLAHYRVLAAVAGGDERASRVADRLTLGRPAISAAVDALCERGLLHRVAVESDQRAAVLSLTPAGLDLLERAEREMSARLIALCARTPDPAAVLRCLGWLGTALDQAILEKTTHPHNHPAVAGPQS